MANNITHLPIASPVSDTPDIPALAGLLQNATRLLEAWLARDLAVKEMYRAGWDDCEAALAATGSAAVLRASRR
jgi:hypothetical protein